MDPKFDQLLSAKIKRLGKFGTNINEATFGNASSAGELTKETILTSSSHTYHHDAVKVGDKNFYISEFGKVYTGEIFRGLIILSNKNESHAINHVELTVNSTCQAKNQTRTLAKETVDVIERGASYSKIIEIRAD